MRRRRRCRFAGAHPPSVAAGTSMRPVENSPPQAGCIQPALVKYQPQWSGDGQGCLIAAGTAPDLAATVEAWPGLPAAPNVGSCRFYRLRDEGRATGSLRRSRRRTIPVHVNYKRCLGRSHNDRPAHHRAVDRLSVCQLHVPIPLTILAEHPLHSVCGSAPCADVT